MRLAVGCLSAALLVGGLSLGCAKGTTSFESDVGASGAAGGNGAGPAGGNGAGAGNGAGPAGGQGGGTSCDPLNPGVVSCGEGICKVTVPGCDPHGDPVPCVPGQPQPQELCNGADDNCDGQTDEGCSCTDGQQQACYSGPPATQGIGPCHGGNQSCSSGQWGACQGQVVPGIEICDNVDNNCDTVVDDGNPGGGTACTTGQPGVCAAGATVCSGGSVACTPVQPAGAEICGDGLDNDCDGQTDEGCGCVHDVCTAGAALTAGCSACVAAICASDSYCCTTAWDSLCIGETQSVCGSAACAASCPHSLCDAGPDATPFTEYCDSPGMCVADICAQDSWCCTVDWDGLCVAEVTSICGLSC